MKYKSIFLMVLFLSLTACGSAATTSDEPAQEPTGSVSPNDTLNELIKKGITVDVDSTIVGNWNVQGFSIGEEDPNIDTTSTITFQADGGIAEYSAKPLFAYESFTYDQEALSSRFNAEIAAYPEMCPDSSGSSFSTYFSSISDIYTIPNIIVSCASVSISKDASEDDPIEEYVTDIITTAMDGAILYEKYSDASISYTVEDAEYNLIVKFIINGIIHPVFLCHSSRENCDTWSAQYDLNSIEESETNGFLVLGADENAIAMLNVANNYYVLLTRIE